MNEEDYGASSAKSPTWFQKGLGTITRMGRGTSPVSQGSTNPLREVFTDLIAYVIFFESCCEKQPPDVNEFREKIVALINNQEQRVKISGVSAEAFREARFAVLSWADEIILNSSWPYRSQWQHLMLTYYGTVNAGEEFFRHLENLPAQANDVREIYYLCLSLGFEGQYAFGDSQHQLKDLKQALYKQLCTNGGDIRQSYARLFPEAYNRAAATPAAPARIKPIWYIVGCSVPIILFLCYWLLLRNEANRLIAIIEKPASTPRDTRSVDLVKELNRNGIPARETNEGVRITLQSFLFKAGSKDLDPRARAKIGVVVTLVKLYAPERRIAIEGHASKEGNVALNEQLAEQRAQVVKEVFTDAGFQNEKTSAQGFGSKIPVPGAPDAENRRVEILVKK